MRLPTLAAPRSQIIADAKLLQDIAWIFSLCMHATPARHLVHLDLQWLLRTSPTLQEFTDLIYSNRTIPLVTPLGFSTSTCSAEASICLATMWEARHIPDASAHSQECLSKYQGCLPYHATCYAEHGALFQSQHGYLPHRRTNTAYLQQLNTVETAPGTTADPYMAAYHLDSLQDPVLQFQLRRSDGSKHFSQSVCYADDLQSFALSLLGRQ